VAADDRPSSFGDELLRVTKLLQVARMRAPRAHPQVDPMAYPLLFHLARRPLRVSALAELVHSDVSTVSRQVSTLVDLGLVSRGPDPDDGRAQALSVTPQGTELLTAIRRGRDQWLARLLTDWSADDLRDFTAHLARFAHDLETSLTDSTAGTTTP
jgi:DNA-binding MarR family transcriptional regulator